MIDALLRNGLLPSLSGDFNLDVMLYVALGEVGYQEGYGNMTKYGAAYGYNGVPWCAEFVSWSAAQAGILASDGGIDPAKTKLKTSPSGIVPVFKYTPYGIKAYGDSFHLNNNNYTPMAGDTVFYGPNGREHTGIVLAVSGGYIYAIEGNYNDRVTVVRRPLNSTYVYGFGSNGGIQSGVVPKNYKVDNSGSGATH